MEMLTASTGVTAPSVPDVTVANRAQDVHVLPGGVKVFSDNTWSYDVASGTIIDLSQWPLVKVKIENKRQFWLELGPNANTVQIDPIGTWATVGYLPPKSEAQYNIHFDHHANESVQYVYNGAGAQSQIGPVPPAALTLLFASISGLLTAADPGGTGASNGAFKYATIMTPDQFATLLELLNNLPSCVSLGDNLANGDAIGAIRDFTDCLIKKPEIVGKIVQTITGKKLAGDLAGILTSGLDALLSTANTLSLVADVAAAYTKGAFAGWTTFHSYQPPEPSAGSGNSGTDSGGAPSSGSGTTGPSDTGSSGSTCTSGAVPVLSTNLSVTPSTAKIGERFTASVTVRNDGCATFTPKVLTVAGKGPGGESDFQDFDHREGVSIPPGGSYLYETGRSFDKAGTFRFRVAYQGRDGGWRDIPGAAGVVATTSITVTDCQPSPVVTVALVVDPTKPDINDRVAASATITNTGCAAFAPSILTAGGRGPGGDSDVQDFNQMGGM